MVHKPMVGVQLRARRPLLYLLCFSFICGALTLLGTNINGWSACQGPPAPYMYYFICGALTLYSATINASSVFKGPPAHLYLLCFICGTLTLYSTTVNALSAFKGPPAPHMYLFRRLVVVYEHYIVHTYFVWVHFITLWHRCALMCYLYML